LFALTRAITGNKLVPKYRDAGIMEMTPTTTTHFLLLVSRSVAGAKTARMKQNGLTD
jgi:hypothetical protein